MKLTKYEIIIENFLRIRKSKTLINRLKIHGSVKMSRDIIGK